VVALVFNSNGKTVASSSNDRSVRLWSIERGEALATLQGHSNLIRSVAVSPNGTYLAGAGSNNRVPVWRLTENERQLLNQITPSIVLKGHTNLVFVVAFSADGMRLASAGQEGIIKVWDLARAEENLQPQSRLTFKGHTDLINTITFNLAGTLLASGSADGTVKLWSTINGELITTLVGHQATVWTVAFSPNGRSLASGGNDGTLRLWDTQTGQLKSGLSNDKIPIANLAYQSKGDFLASARYDGTIEIWQTADTNRPPLILKGHQGTVGSVAFSPDLTNSALLLSGGNDGTIRLWDMESSEEVARFQHEGAVRSVAFTADGKRMVSTGDSGLIKLWDIVSGELVETYRDFQPYEGVNISAVTGLTGAQRATLLALGAVES
jgi:WD40 repeat protein